MLEHESRVLRSSTSTTAKRGVAPNAIELHPILRFACLIR
jgi:hypothetical protein